ncbi:MULTISPECIES: transglycosylase SLT domain-containing protein [Thermocrispum]|uniref:Transglycosylase SLT domain-containing protein n=2 Tax=Thermocrispum agreste TaxID=37925 RepID=A0ABD6FJ38_9PSEU|nr:MULTISPECIES: transglycosylase SLT domain-containing protein [Thermocrispum]
MGLGMPPNWGEVTEREAKIATADPGAVRAIEAKLSTAADSADDQSSAFKRLAGELREAWQKGSDADALIGHLTKLSSAGAKVNGKLEKAAKALDALADVLENTKKQVKQIRENAEKQIQKNNAEAEKAMRLNDPYEKGLVPGPYVPDAQIQADTVKKNEKVAQDAAEDIQRKLDEADSAIADAMKTLDDIDGGYTSVGKPGESGTSPSSSEPVKHPTKSGPDLGGNGSGGYSGAYSGGGGGGGGYSGGGGGGGGGYGPSGPPPTSGPPPGNVEAWIREAIKILQEHGVPVTEEHIDEIWTIIQKESGGNPHAINKWDSNWERGTPSKGLMQCIDPTFQRYKLPGHDDIWNPVDNIIAGVRYIFDRYGGFEGHPGLKSMARGGAYQGY